MGNVRVKKKYVKGGLGFGVFYSGRLLGFLEGFGPGIFIFILWKSK